ncbi:hypothetical protein GCM10023238_14960 [Streptomyces heliomycini]
MRPGQKAGGLLAGGLALQPAVGAPGFGDCTPIADGLSEGQRVLEDPSPFRLPAQVAGRAEGLIVNRSVAVELGKAAMVTPLPRSRPIGPGR